MLKTGELVDRNDAIGKSYVRSCDNTDTEEGQDVCGVMLRIDQHLIHEYDLVLEFTTLSSTGMVVIKDKFIYVEPDYVNWIFDYIKELDEQSSFGDLFRHC